MTDAPQPGPLRRATLVALRVSAVLLVVAYPVAVYVGLTTFSARTVGLVIAALLVPTILARVRAGRGAQLRSLALLPASVLVLVALAALVDDERFILAMPVLVNLVLLAHFAGSLRTATPLIERFARLEVDELSPAEIAYCRRVTALWSLFFVLNAATAAVLALAAPLAWWALYNGLIAYVLIGLLFTVEYVVRKYRFRRFGSGLHDRLLARAFPPERS